MRISKTKITSLTGGLLLISSMAFCKGNVCTKNMENEDRGMGCSTRCEKFTDKKFQFKVIEHEIAEKGVISNISETGLVSNTSVREVKELMRFNYETGEVDILVSKIDNSKRVDVWIPVVEKRNQSK